MILYYAISCSFFFCNVQIHFYVYGNKKRNCISSFQCRINIDITNVKNLLLFTNCVLSSFNFGYLACMLITDHNYLISRLLNQSCFVAVGIIHAESPVQFLFWSSTGGDADSKKKFFEVDEPVPVCVKRPKYVVAKVSGIATWETLAVDLHKGWRTEFSVWAVRYKALVPLLDRVFVIICICLQELHIVFRKSFRPRSTLTHDSLFANWFPQKLSYALSQSGECLGSAGLYGQPDKRGGVSSCKEGRRTGCL